MDMRFLQLSTVLISKYNAIIFDSQDMNLQN
jgi:hypothetical protein